MSKRGGSSYGRQRPIRVKIFLQVLAHDNLLTNYERWKRRITDVPDCRRCNGHKEDGLHAIKDCKYARDVCNALIPPDSSNWFFSLDLEKWLDKLLRLSHVAREENRWTQKMIITCWWQQRWRNHEVFNRERLPLYRRLQWIEDYVKADSVLRSLSSLQARSFKRWNTPL